MPTFPVSSTNLSLLHRRRSRIDTALPPSGYLQQIPLFHLRKKRRISPFSLVVFRYGKYPLVRQWRKGEQTIMITVVPPHDYVRLQLSYIF
jgi:hypothetical protein